MTIMSHSDVLGPSGNTRKVLWSSIAQLICTRFVALHIVANSEDYQGDDLQVLISTGDLQMSDFLSSMEKPIARQFHQIARTDIAESRARSGFSLCVALYVTFSGCTHVRVSQGLRLAEDVLCEHLHINQESFDRFY